MWRIKWGLKKAIGSKQDKKEKKQRAKLIKGLKTDPRGRGRAYKKHG